ncbi:MAG: ABC transporter permease subunit [Candidatus Lokiarchaeota archaeon]|nr:ABC transporter permease subunit [Candidatus Lokiarchaeota archaeon]
MAQMTKTKIISKEKPFESDKNLILKMLKFIATNLKFLLIPGYRLEDLTLREIEFEKNISKRRFIRRLKSVLTLIGIGIIFAIITMAVFPEWLAPYSFEEANGLPGNSWFPPSEDYPLGQTEFGRDILSRIIFGARSSLTIALPSITFSVVCGVIIGVVAAYYGGWIDAVIMRLVDIFLAFPGLILAMVFIAIWSPRMEYIMLAYGIIGIPFYSRLIRGSVLQSRTLPYVEAAKVAGAGNWRIMFKHILPNCIQPIIISFTFNIGGIILALAGLAFLGYSDVELIEWGRDIDIGRGQLVNAPWAAFWPGIMILFTVLGFMLLGDGLRDALDPRMRNL